MRSTILVMFVLVGCVDAPEDTRPVVTIDHVTKAVTTRAPEPREEIDVCALASQLEATNVCSLICEPDAMAAELAAGGLASGTCIELLCALPEAQSVTVGVCLPPAAP